ncbi:MAG: hypothetical protein ACK5N0_15540 [Synechococcaceae cyanobacterium]
MVSTLLLAACSGSAPQVSDTGRSRCQRRADLEDLPLLRPLVYQHCLGTIEAKLAVERREELQRRQEHQRLLAQALARCRKKRSALQVSLRNLRQAERDLANLRASGEPPLPTLPSRPNEATLQRYTREDAELDRQRFQDSLMAWQRRLAQRQLLRQRRQSALDEAQLRLDKAALHLNKLQPDLLAEGIELDPVIARRLMRCDPRELEATLPDAPPVVKAPMAISKPRLPTRPDGLIKPSTAPMPAPSPGARGANAGLPPR